MSTFNANDIKFRLAQEYGLPESEIDESVLALYILIDKGNQNSHFSSKQQHKDITQALEEFRGILRNKQKSIIYDDPKSAFWGNFAARGVTGVALSIAIIVAALVFKGWYSDQQLVKNLQNLKEHVKVTPEGYFISKESYETRKDGIIIKL